MGQGARVLRTLAKEVTEGWLYAHHLQMPQCGRHHRDYEKHLIECSQPLAFYLLLQLNYLCHRSHSNRRRVEPEHF
jgi:hypothetical protein